MKSATASLLVMSVSDNRKVTFNTSTIVGGVDPNTWLHSLDGQGYVDALIGYDREVLGFTFDPAPTEKCASDWVNRWGWEQALLDAEVAQCSDDSRKSVWQAMQPYSDDDLKRKNDEACEGIEENLSELVDQVDATNDALRIDVPWTTAS